MVRSCPVCGKSFVAQRATAKYCSSSCRGRAYAERAAAAPAVPAAALVPAPDGLAAAVRAQLDAAGRAGSPLGMQAVTLAARVESPHETGAAVAALSRELRTVLDVALAGVAVAADPVDELRVLRDRKRHAG